MQLAYEKLGAFHLYLEPVERTRRGTAEHFPVEREGGSVARAKEILIALIPVIGAAEVSALRREGEDLLSGNFTTQAVDFSLVTFQPSTRVRRKTISSGSPGRNWLMSPASTQAEVFFALGGNNR